MDDPETAGRAALRRGALLYFVLLAADVLVLVYVALNRASGFAYVTLTIVGVVGLLLVYQVVQYVRDLGAPLAESEGVVVRKWARADLFIFMQRYYVTVDRAVFRVRPEDYVHLTEGAHVKVVHFPHTLNVVSIHGTQRAGGV